MLFRSNEKIEQIKIQGISHNLKDTELSENELNKLKEVKRAINESLTLLNESLSSHTIVLYLKGKDGLFEIEDFISQIPESIDIGQRLNFRTGYFGWVLKTNTPFSAENLKRGDKNVFYYKKEIPVKSLFVTPIVIRREEDPGKTSEEPIGVLVVDSLERPHVLHLPDPVRNVHDLIVGDLQLTKPGEGTHHVGQSQQLVVVEGQLLQRRDRKSTRLNSSHSQQSRMPSSA